MNSEGVRRLHHEHVLFSLLESVFPTLQIISQTEVYDFFKAIRKLAFSNMANYMKQFLQCYEFLNSVPLSKG